MMFFNAFAETKKHYLKFSIHNTAAIAAIATLLITLNTFSGSPKPWRID